MKFVLFAGTICLVCVSGFSQTTGRIPTASPRSPVSGLSSAPVGGLTPSPPMLTPAPVGGLNSAPVGGLTPNAVGGFNQAPVGGLNPAPITGLSPAPITGLSPSPNVVLPTPQVLVTNPVSGFNPTIPLTTNTNGNLNGTSPSPF